MTQRVLGYPVHFAEPRVRKDTRGINGILDKPFRFEREFINGLDREVIVRFRNGLPVRLPRAEGKHYDKFTIKDTYFLNQEIIRVTARIFDSVHEKSPESLKILKEAYEINQQNHSPMYSQAAIVLSVEYVITGAELKKLGGTTYFHGPDVVISSNLDVENIIHPDSGQGMLERTLEKVRGEVNQGDGLFIVEIIDNLGDFGDRFINIDNLVYPIRAKQDGTRKDGVYVTRGDATIGDYGRGDIKVTYYQPDKNLEVYRCDGVSLYRSYADAHALGDVDAIRKEQLQTRDLAIQQGKRDLEEMKLENDRIKFDADQKSQEFNRQKQEFEASRADAARKHEMEITRMKEDMEKREHMYKELDMERARVTHALELERLRKKEVYEERSQARKDTSEWLKILPGVIIGAAALGGTIYSIFKKTA